MYKTSLPWYGVFALILVLFFILVHCTGCACTYHEKDGELKSNKPSAEDLHDLNVM